LNKCFEYTDEKTGLTFSITKDRCIFVEEFSELDGFEMDNKTINE
jgi:hypothetical protein